MTKSHYMVINALKAKCQLCGKCIIWIVSYFSTPSLGNVPCSMRQEMDLTMCCWKKVPCHLSYSADIHEEKHTTAWQPSVNNRLSHSGLDVKLKKGNVSQYSFPYKDNRLLQPIINKWKFIFTANCSVLNFGANTLILDYHIISNWHIPSSSFCQPTVETCLARGTGVPSCYEQQPSSQCVDQRNGSPTGLQQLAPVVAAWIPHVSLLGC